MANKQVETAPPLLRLRLGRARDLVVLMLQAEGPEGTAEDRRDLYARLRIELAGEPWPGDPKPLPATERRHARAEELARKVVLGWIGHPAVSREVVAAKPALMALVEPLGMPDQLNVSRVTTRFLDVAPFWPDGTESPDPFEGASPSLLQDAQRIRPLLVCALTELAKRIESAGARLDPADPGVLLVLAQLSLLNMDLECPAADLVDDLNLLPPGWIDRDAAQMGHAAPHVSRHGRTARFQADLAAAAEFLARRLGPPAIGTPYAGGKKRRTRTDTLQLQKALAALVTQDPSLTPSSLLVRDHGEDHPALNRLRAALGKEADWLPERRRIERLWPKSRQRSR
ncbi:MAG: hypothetical protein ABSE58_09090 [Candidatus Limnocylindrales bacterium]